MLRQKLVEHETEFVEQPGVQRNVEIISVVGTENRSFVREADLERQVSWGRLGVDKRPSVLHRCERGAARPFCSRLPWADGFGCWGVRQRDTVGFDVAEIEQDLRGAGKRVPGEPTGDELLLEAQEAVVAALQDERAASAGLEVERGALQQRDELGEVLGRAAEEGRRQRRGPGEVVGAEDALDVEEDAAAGDVEEVGRVAGLGDQVLGQLEVDAAHAGVVVVGGAQQGQQARQAEVNGVAEQGRELDLVVDADRVALEVLEDEVEDARGAVEDERGGRVAGEVGGEVAGGVGVERKAADAEELWADLDGEHAVGGQHGLGAGGERERHAVAGTLVTGRHKLTS